MLGHGGRINGTDLLSVKFDLVFDDSEVVAPEIGRLDVVVGVRVPSFVGRSEFVELIDEQENGIKLRGVVHESVEGGI